MKLKHLLLFLGILNSSLSISQDISVRMKHFNISSTGLAIQGYDPVAYFLQQKPVKGKKELAVIHLGLTYYFSSASNKAIFLQAPSAYEPEYGGWCAYAMGAKGEKVSVDPATFKIVNNKLYLFYNRLFNNTLTDWNKDEMILKSKANHSWEKIIH